MIEYLYIINSGDVLFGEDYENGAECNEQKADGSSCNVLADECNGICCKPYTYL